MKSCICCCCSVTHSGLTLCNPRDCTTPDLPVHHQLPELTPNSCPSSRWCHPHLILCRPLLLLPPIPPRIRVFSNESVLCIRWPKYWNFSTSPSNECSGLISFRIDWFDILYISPFYQLSSLLDDQFHEGRAFRLFYSLLYFQEREQCPVCSGCLSHIC